MQPTVHVSGFRPTPAIEMTHYQSGLRIHSYWQRLVMTFGLFRVVTLVSFSKVQQSGLSPSSVNEPLLQSTAMENGMVDASVAVFCTQVNGCPKRFTMASPIPHSHTYSYNNGGPACLSLMPKRTYWNRETVVAVM